MAIALVQHKVQPWGETIGQPSLTVGLPNATVTGNMLVALGDSYEGGGTTTQTFTDNGTGPNTWSTAATITGTNSRVTHKYVASINTGRSGHSCTLSTGSGSADFGLQLAEVSGQHGTPYDNSATNTATSANATTTSCAAVSSNSVIFFGSYTTESSPGTITHTWSGSTWFDDDGTYSSGDYKENASGGTETGTWTFGNGSRQYWAIISVYKGTAVTAISAPGYYM